MCSTSKMRKSSYPHRVQNLRHAESIFERLQARFGQCRPANQLERDLDTSGDDLAHVQGNFAIVNDHDETSRNSGGFIMITIDNMLLSPANSSPSHFSKVPGKRTAVVSAGAQSLSTAAA